MTRGFLTLACAMACLGATNASAYAAVSVGSQAPALEPSEWLNVKGPLSWKDLKGRLVLVEKWATW